jgi:hypothetical protein
MPMLEGSVVIEPTTGVALVQLGAAGEVFAALNSGQVYGDLATTNPPAYAQAREQIAVIARAVAKLVLHIQINALVTTPPGVLVATAGTAAAQTGATTAPGIGTVT